MPFDHLYFRFDGLFTAFYSLFALLNISLRSLTGIDFLFFWLLVQVKWSILPKINIPIDKARLKMIKRCFGMKITNKVHYIVLIKFQANTFKCFRWFILFFVHIILINYWIDQILPFSSQIIFLNLVTVVESSKTFRIILTQYIIWGPKTKKCW